MSDDKRKGWTRWKSDKIIAEHVITDKKMMSGCHGRRIIGVPDKKNNVILGICEGCGETIIEWSPEGLIRKKIFPEAV